MDFPWYVQPRERSEIEQGDILFNYPIVEPVLPVTGIGKILNTKQIEVNITIYNLIVISHSCDIEDGTIDAVGTVQLLPLYSFKDYVDSTKFDKSKQGYLFSDNLVALQLLNKSEKIKHKDIPNDYFVVDFMNPKNAPIASVRTFLRRRSGPPRLRLNHPYVEKLANRFSSVYSRVAVPNDYKKPNKINPVQSTEMKN